MATDGRSRNFACIVYPESAPEDWIDIIDKMHVECLISPLHDKDINPTGEPKKPHYHVIMLFDGKKSDQQVRAMFAKFGGVGKETVVSIRGYSRYLCHMDNPEKYQYLPEYVQALGGADYQKCIELVTDKYKTIREMRDFIAEKDIMSFSDLFDYAAENNFTWFRCLCDNGAVIIKEYLKSRLWTKDQRIRQEIDLKNESIHNAINSI